MDLWQKIKILSDRYDYSNFWNIGFCNQTYENLLDSKKLKKVHWMKHPYKDRWFADPFILKVTEEEIVVLVEEYPLNTAKGILCELVVDRKMYELKQRYIILELDTHLSYPAIIRENGKIYVYPENSESGKLYMYEYDEVQHKLINEKCILNMGAIDSTIFSYDGSYFLVCTKHPTSTFEAYLYKADNIFGPYVLASDNPINTGKEFSRPGGDWISYKNCIYRPAQICTPRYGSGLSLMKTNLIDNKYSEMLLFKLMPTSWRYNFGLHTLNTRDGIMVVDGYGYEYPFFGRAIHRMKLSMHFMLRILGMETLNVNAKSNAIIL